MKNLHISLNSLATGLILTALGFVVLGYPWAQSAAEHPSAVFNFYRVIFLPLLLTCLLGLWLWQQDKMVEGDKDTVPWRFILSFGIASYFVVLSTLKLLRLYSANYDIFDAGIYYNKLWRLNNMTITEGIWTALSEGHFQPVNIIWVLLPKTNFTFEIAMLLETAAFSTGAIAVFKLANFLIKSRNAAGLLSISYLLNPQLQFNDILGYHPDFIVLPALLWGFYFLERGKQRMAIFVFSLLLLAGEPWIPLCGFIGFSIVLMRRYWPEGLLLNIISIILFFYVFLYWLGVGDSENSANHVLATGGNFQILYEPTVANFVELLSDPRKTQYFVMVLLPVLFSVFLTPIATFILIPEFAKSILSNEPLHYATEGHYTLAYIGVGFWALIKFIERSKAWTLHRKRWGPSVALAVSLGLSVGHGSLPYAYNFWADISGGAFHVKKYTFFERGISLELALGQSGIKPWHSVETDNQVFSRTIGQRRELSLFPSEELHNTDFVILTKNNAITSGAEGTQNEHAKRRRNAIQKLESCFLSVLNTDNFVIYQNERLC